MEFNNVFTIKKTVSKQQFLKNVVTKLFESGDDYSPKIENIMFGEVKETVKEIAAMTADVDLTYTCSIGYGSDNPKNILSWAPYNGNAHSKDVVAYSVSDTSTNNATEKINRFIECDFQYKCTGICSINLPIEGSASLNDSTLLNLKESCGSFTFSKVRIPGDCHTEASYSFTTYVKQVDCIICPCYYVEYTWKKSKKKYQAVGYAFDDSIILEKPDWFDTSHFDLLGSAGYVSDNSIIILERPQRRDAENGDYNEASPIADEIKKNKDKYAEAVWEKYNKLEKPIDKARIIYRILFTTACVSGGLWINTLVFPIPSLIKTILFVIALLSLIPMIVLKVICNKKSEDLEIKRGIDLKAAQEKDKEEEEKAHSEYLNRILANLGINE